VDEDDTEATQLVLEALFDVKAPAFELKEFLMGDDYGEEEEEDS
jgi:hypothetical protein